MRLRNIRAAACVAGMAAGLTLTSPPDLLQASSCAETGKSECGTVGQCVFVPPTWWVLGCWAATLYWPSSIETDDPDTPPELTEPEPAG